MTYITRQREASRRGAIREIKQEMLDRYGQKITDSDARAMLRGETDTASYEIAFRIGREWGILD